MTVSLRGRGMEQLEQAESAAFTDGPGASFSVTTRDETHRQSVNRDDLRVHCESVDEVEFRGLHTVGGLDISFRDETGNEGIAVLVVLSFPDFEVRFFVSSRHADPELTPSVQVLSTTTRQISLVRTPYIHSYLAFREAPHYVSLVEELRASGQQVPQVLFVDGNGRWHVRQAGSAVAVGLGTGIPTIGVAKEYHPIHVREKTHGSEHDLGQGPRAYLLSQKAMRNACRIALKTRGEWIGLDSPESLPSTPGTAPFWGAALLSSPVRSASNPIFVSPGHLVSLETSVRLALACCPNARVPEPIRQADLTGRAEVKQIWS
ncbi:hypothetical protein JCM10212_003162 [Sporobolomyces blumeae]